MNREREFIIYAPSFNENVGGIIVLHRLCDLINKSGRSAYIAPFWDPRRRYNIRYKIRRAIFHIRNLLKGKNSIGFKIHREFNTPIRKGTNSADAIILYPEIVSGNPLKAKNVVRWLLHKPRFHTGVADFGPDDLIFYFQDAFNAEKLPQKIGGHLQILYVRSDIYKKTNFGKRRGACYMLRKESGRAKIPDVDHGILIDKFSHEKCAKIFNEVEVFICYDQYTLYSQYAAMCGCLSVVIPVEGVTEEEWQPTREGRFGLAYGFDKVAWAKETQDKVSVWLEKLERESSMSVAAFIRTCEEHFS